MAPQPTRSPTARPAPPRVGYRPLDHLVVRAPLLPVEAYRSLGGGNGLAAVASAPLVRQALAVASPSLAAALDRAVPGAAGATRLEGKLLRYLIRMSTRPTPFGLFAGVGVARWADRTDLAVAGPPVTRTRLDMEWLLGLVLRLEADPRLRRHLRLVANSAAFEHGGRIHLSERAPAAGPSGAPAAGRPGSPAGGPGRSGSPAPDVSVRATGAARRALAMARRPIRYADLAAALLEAVPAATPARVDRLLGQLCEATLLLSDLRPPLTTADPAGWVLDRLTTAASGPGRSPDGLPTGRATEPAGGTDGRVLARDQAAELAGLVAEVAALDEAAPAAATAAYTRLAERAGTAGGDAARSLLQVDSRLDLRGAGVNPAVGEVAARAAELLLRMSPLPDGPPHLAAYRRAFLRRYGADRTVPLLELLDPRFGLGPLGRATGAPPPAGAGRRNQLLLDLAGRALRERLTVLELDDGLAGRLATWTPDPGGAPATLELYVGVAAESAAALDAGEFTVVVGHAPGVSPAGRSLGRFADLLPSADQAAGAGTADPDRPDRPGVVVAELVYLPRRLRQANVAVRPPRHGHELVVGTSPGVPADRVVPLDELVVGVGDGRLRLWWPARGAELEVVAGHMLTATEAPAVCRFLAEVGRDGRAQLGAFSWGPAAGFPFLPRVQAGQAVLRPASWRLDPEGDPTGRPVAGDQAAGADQPPDAPAAALRRWRAEWAVPRQVLVGGGDRRLLLDLDDPAQAGQLRAELDSGRSVTVHEALPGPEAAWLPGPGGRFLTELVVPLALAGHGPSPAPGQPGTRATTPGQPGTRATTTPGQPEAPAPASTGPGANGAAPAGPAVVRGQRLRPPGSDWLYAKLYGPREDEDELLAGPVRELADGAVRAGEASSWFFLRYADPDPHLRLRFRGSPGRLTGVLLPRLCAWAGGLVAEGNCERFAIDTYEREVERYGGPDGVAAAEDLFAADSRCVTGLLAVTGPGRQLDRIGLAVLAVDDLLDALGLDPGRRLAWYGQRVADRRASGTEHRRRKAILRPLLADPEGLRAVPGGPALLDHLAERRAALARPARRLAELAAADRLRGRTLEELAASFVHLHCNRLLGPDPAAERLVLGLLLRTREGLARAPVAQPG